MDNEKSYFGTQNGSLAICHIRGRDDRAVRACATARTTWSLHCQLAPWKSCAYSGYTTCSEIWGVETSTVQSGLGAIGLSLHLWKNISGTTSLQITTR